MTNTKMSKVSLKSVMKFRSPINTKWLIAGNPKFLKQCLLTIFITFFIFFYCVFVHRWKKYFCFLTISCIELVVNFAFLEKQNMDRIWRILFNMQSWKQDLSDPILFLNWIWISTVRGESKKIRHISFKDIYSFQRTLADLKLEEL